MKKVLLFCLLISFGGLMKNGYTAGLKVVILDVGMGQSILLVDNNHGILIDTGIRRYSSHILNRMKLQGVRKLDYLLLSHLHPDHAAGYLQIREAWPNTPVFDNCHASPKLDPSEEDFFFTTRKALEKDPLHDCLKAGDSLSWQGHKIQILWPEKVHEPMDLNAHSLVLLLTTKHDGTLLVMGDVNRDIERGLRATLGALLEDSSIDLYVAAHHGAIDSTDPGFLNTLRPKVSMVSVGQDNPYGYPSAERLAILAKHSGRVLRTDEDGEICFEFDAKTLVPCMDM